MALTSPNYGGERGFPSACICTAVASSRHSCPAHCLVHMRSLHPYSCKKSNRKIGLRRFPQGINRYLVRPGVLLAPVEDWGCDRSFNNTQSHYLLNPLPLAAVRPRCQPIRASLNFGYATSPTSQITTNYCNLFLIKLRSNSTRNKNHLQLISKILGNGVGTRQHNAVTAVILTTKFSLNIELERICSRN